MRGHLKSKTYGLLSNGPANTATIAAAIGRTIRQANAYLCWMASRGYVRRSVAGKAGRINSRPAVWEAV